MKLYIYDRNVKYNERLSDFITMSIEERYELLKKYKQLEKEVEVEFFASGSTCLCYKVIGDDKSKAIYKQFCPLSFEEKGYIVRRDDAVYIHDEVEIDFVKEQYDNFLRQTFNNVVGIGESYNIKEINMFIRPEIVLTNLGYMFCAEITGETLDESYKELLSALNKEKCASHFLGESLYKIFRTLQTVKVAHEKDTLILDLKSENLLNVTGDDKKEELFIRLIDFGSCINLETMESIIGQEGVENFLDQYVYSNSKYYSQDDVKNVVENIDIDKDNFKECAKSLDITAVKKIFCDILLCATNGFKTLDENKKAIQTDSLEDILRDFFIKFSNFISENHFETFNIYWFLRKFLNANNVYDCLKILLNVLSVIGEQIFWPYDIRGNDKDDIIEQQKKAIIFNDIYKKKMPLFEDKAINSFKGVINFCKEILKKDDISTKELYWKLLLDSDCNSLINEKLQADIEYKGNTYTRFKQQGRTNKGIKKSLSPIVDIYNDSGDSPILLIGGGGLGKSTVSAILQATLLKENTPCILLECKDIIFENISDIISIITKEELILGSVIIFDAWDELREELKIKLSSQIATLIEKNNCKVIVTSRYNPSISSIIDDERKSFEKFQTAEILEFNESEILQLVKGDIDISSRFFNLLSNTMYLSMYMGIDDDEKYCFHNVENSFQFIRRYFEMLIKNKRQNQTTLDIDKVFSDCGRIIFEEYIGVDAEEGSNINAFRTFNNIITEHKNEQGNYLIKTSQFRYRTFCLSIFLQKKLSKSLKYSDFVVPEELKYYYNREHQEALIFLGESLTKEQVNRLKEVIDYSYKENYFSTNACYILLGANHQCFDDEYFGIKNEIFNDLDVACQPKDNKYSIGDDRICNEFWTDNEYITSINIYHLINLASDGLFHQFEGLCNLREIKVSNKHLIYASDGNCLIRKKDNALLLGCFNSIIPSYVTSIEEGAFYKCIKLHKINIPNSVTTIANYAFQDCRNLQELKIPDSVLEANKIATNCSGLKKISIGKGLHKIDSLTFDIVGTSIYSHPNEQNNLLELDVSPYNEFYYSDNNCLIEKKTGKLVLGCQTSIITEDVKIIGENAFAGVYVDEITIPEGIKSIERHAFANSTIKKCIFPKSVQKIEDDVFYGCYLLEEVEIPNLQYLGDFAFNRCMIKKLIVPDTCSLYGRYGVSYSAYYQIMCGDIYARKDDGTIMPPPYFLKLMEIVKTMVKDAISGIMFISSFSTSFDKIKNSVIVYLNHSRHNDHPNTSNFLEDDENFILRQKARLHINAILNETGTLEDFYSKTGIEYFSNGVSVVIKEYENLNEEDFAFTTLEDFEDKCMQIMRYIISGHINRSKEESIVVAKNMLREARDKNKTKAIDVLTRVVKELEFLTNKDYKIVKKQIFGW